MAKIFYKFSGLYRRRQGQDRLSLGWTQGLHNQHGVVRETDRWELPSIVADRESVQDFKDGSQNSSCISLSQEAYWGSYLHRVCRLYDLQGVRNNFWKTWGGVQPETSGWTDTHDVRVRVSIAGAYSDWKNHLENGRWTANALRRYPAKKLIVGVPLTKSGKKCSWGTACLGRALEFQLSEIPMRWINMTSRLKEQADPVDDCGSLAFLLTKRFDRIIKNEIKENWPRNQHTNGRKDKQQ